MNMALELLPDQLAIRLQVHEALCRTAADHPNSEWLARMLSSQAAGFGALPERLGLTSKQFGAMLAHHFPGAERAALGAGTVLALDRVAEREELRTLFLVHAADLKPERVWMADILVAGCMGDDHLWQDLGLWSREYLSRLMTQNFPTLAANNVHDMKWKKFLYKQLCEKEGINACRAPSCEYCVDYLKCFGPEE